MLHTHSVRQNADAVLMSRNKMTIILIIVIVEFSAKYFVDDQSTKLAD